MPSDSHDEFLTVAEVAQLLRLNQQTVRNWIDQGSLPAIRVGTRRVRIPRTELDAFLMESSGSNSTNAQPEPEAVAQSTGDGRVELGQVLDRARAVLDEGDRPRARGGAPRPRRDRESTRASRRKATGLS